MNAARRFIYGHTLIGEADASAFDGNQIPIRVNILAPYDKLAESITVSLEANAEVWYGEFDSDLTDKNIKFLKEFLIHRYKLLNKEWKE